MESRTLNLEEAVKLYSLLSPYLPNKEDGYIDDYIGEIFDNMLDGNPHDYISVIELMTGETEEYIRERDAIEILNVFIEGLTKNRILYLKKFCEQITYG